MAVSPSAFIDPVGTLTTSLFPGDDQNALTARVTAYIAAAATDARVMAIVGAGGSSDAATTAYAYWRAYSAVVQRMNTEPLSVRLNDPDKGSHAYSAAQIGQMQQLADSFNQQLDAMLPPDDEPVTPAMSMGVSNSFGW